MSVLLRVLKLFVKSLLLLLLIMMLVDLVVVAAVVEVADVVIVVACLCFLRSRGPDKVMVILGRPLELLPFGKPFRKPSKPSKALPSKVMLSSDRETMETKLSKTPKTNRLTVEGGWCIHISGDSMWS